MRRFKIFLATVACCLFVGMPAATASAANFGNPLSQACQKAIAQNAAAKDSPACNTTGQDPVTGKSGILYKVSRIFALLAGISAVIIIVIGGFMYVTSAGDAQKVTSARHMIVGACIGLVIIVFAETILVFIINTIS